MFQVKICGITSAADARAAAEAGADAIGLNFYPPSPRYVDLFVAEEIVRGLPSGLATVGVFVNSPSAEVRTIAARLKLDYVQIHGDEPPEFLTELDGLQAIRAVRCGDNLQAAFAYLDECRRLGCRPQSLLIDALRPGHYGGTGEPVDWRAVVAARDRLAAIPTILAGGLNPHNVAEAISVVSPAAVDTASGVESAPGKKSPQMIRAFVDAALGAFRRQAAAAR
jgi:phosphoribosylanthranilate isomerase